MYVQVLLYTFRSVYVSAAERAYGFAVTQNLQTSCTGAVSLNCDL